MKKATVTLAMLLTAAFIFAQQIRFKQTSMNLVEPSILYDANGDLVIAMTSEDDPNCSASCANTGMSNIIVTKRKTDGTLIWNKSFNFSDVDRAMHIANDGNNVVVLGNVHRTVTVGTKRNYEHNPVVFVLDQNGTMVKGKRIYASLSQGYYSMDFVASHITPDGTGGYIVTGVSNDQVEDCFISNNVVKIPTVVRLDASLNVVWSRHMLHPNAPTDHPYVSANHALMDPNHDIVYITGQDRASDGTGSSRPVAFVTALNISTAATVWHKSYGMEFDDHRYYGVKLLYNEKEENLVWLLRAAVDQGIGADGVFGIAEVNPGSGAVSNYMIHSIEEGVVSDMELLEEGIIGVNSLTSKDNQTLVGVDWPGNNAIFCSLYIGTDPSPNVSLCNAPYFELNTSIAMFYPKNLAVNVNQEIHTITTGLPFAGKETIQLTNFSIDGQMGAHFPFPSGPTICNTGEWEYSSASMTLVEVVDGIVGETPTFTTESVPGGDFVTVTMDDCYSGMFADVLMDVEEAVTENGEKVLFPNPVQQGGSIFLNVGLAEGDIDYLIFAMDGRKVLSGSVNDSENHEISVEGLFPGVYLLRWSDQTGNSNALELVIE